MSETRPDPCRHLERSLWHRYRLLRWLRRCLLNYGVGYVTMGGDEAQFWPEAMRHAPISYRWLGSSVSLDEIDAELRTSSEWSAVRKRYQHGDRIWPFIINPDTMAMRLGYVIVRNGKPVAGIITIVS
jgi:hypothetical protein